ncbi:hypothetical protein D9757_006936 [Collybiopsis confluens]|uniref:Zn(2)-C6 fungal-type domain-containing protein n=1 Tax=Collybiopsis confluens TaxID=2823264 RepID=A0A8H5M7C9_9AGAR|nr:hypothetical protein D9757_006936 [Collybiopsis confluens]
MFTSSPTVNTNKRKKLPACDRCKARRVLCHPQPTVSGSCPRCLEKGEECKTTPVVRKKRRTKAELEGEKPSSIASSISKLVTLQQAPSRSDVQPSISRLKESAISYGLASPTLDIPPSLVKELFQDTRKLPLYHHPLFPLKRLESALASSSWHLPDLTPQDRVLAQCSIAIAARISSSSFLIGLDRADLDDLASRSPLNTRMPIADFRLFGQNRESLCEQLRAEAAWLAQQEGVITTTCVSNAASLEILAFLESKVTGNGNNIYLSAYVHQLRELYDGPDEVQGDATTQTRYSAFLMGNAVSAVLSGKYVPFTAQDEVLLCGEDTTSLEQVLAKISPASLVTSPLYTVMRPMSLHMIRMAREISEGITGVNARRRPLNESKLIHQLNALDLFHSVVSGGISQVQKLKETLDEKQFQYVRFCAYPLLHGWGTLVLIVFEEVKRRMEIVPPATVAASSSSERWRSAEVITNVEGSQMGRARSRLELLFLQIRAMTVQAALEIAQSLEEIPALSRVTHSTWSPLDRWARFLIEDVGDDEEWNRIGIGRRIEALERFRDGLNLSAFSWIDRTGTLEAVEAFLSFAVLAQNDCNDDDLTRLESSFRYGISSDGMMTEVQGMLPNVDAGSGLDSIWSLIPVAESKGNVLSWDAAAGELNVGLRI